MHTLRIKMPKGRLNVKAEISRKKAEQYLSTPTNKKKPITKRNNLMP